CLLLATRLQYGRRTDPCCVAYCKSLLPSAQTWRRYMMRSQAITEGANLIAQSVPDLKRMAWHFSIAGWGRRVINAFPGREPSLIRFVGSQTRALDDAARLIEQHLEPEKLIPLLKLGGCLRLADALRTPLLPASKHREGVKPE